MTDTDIPSGKKQVRNIFGIERTVGDSVRGGRRMENRGLFLRIESGRIVVIHGPAAVSNGIFKLSAAADIILIHDVIADISAAFPFSGEESNPVKFPISVFFCFRRIVFDVIPDPEGKFQKVPSDFF